MWDRNVLLLTGSKDSAKVGGHERETLERGMCQGRVGTVGGVLLLKGLAVAAVMCQNIPRSKSTSLVSSCARAEWASL